MKKSMTKNVKGAWRSFMQNRAAFFGFTVLCMIAFIALAGPYLYPADPFAIAGAPFTRPGHDGFLLGTDYLGRDLLAGIVSGAGVSLLIAVVAAVLAMGIGIGMGAAAGFYRGGIEQLILRITEFFQTLPPLLFAMVIVALFGAEFFTIIFAIGIVSWTPVARIARTEFLRLGTLDYVTASRAAGAGNVYLIFRVILPGAAPAIIVQGALMVGSAILFEAGLAFLGLTDPNIASWGQMLGGGRQYILDAAYLVTIPGMAIFITVFAIALVGDGLNDAFNPRKRRR